MGGDLKVRGLLVNSTTDAGATWQSVALPSSLAPQGFDGANVSFVSPADGWLTIQPYHPPSQVGTSVVLSSTDGGATWNVVNGDTPVAQIDFLSPQIGWGVSPDGSALYESNDAGTAWQQVALPGPGSGGSAPTWKAVTMPTFFGEDGVVLAEPASGNAVVESTSDGGNTWTASATPFAGVAPSSNGQRPTTMPFAATSPNTFLYWAGDDLFETSDGGHTWTSFEQIITPSHTGTLTVGGSAGQSIAPFAPLVFSSATTGFAIANGQTEAGSSPSVNVATNDGAVVASPSFSSRSARFHRAGLIPRSSAGTDAPDETPAVVSVRHPGLQRP